MKNCIWGNPTLDIVFSLFRIQTFSADDQVCFFFFSLIYASLSLPYIPSIHPSIHPPPPLGNSLLDKGIGSKSGKRYEKTNGKGKEIKIKLQMRISRPAAAGNPGEIIIRKTREIDRAPHLLAPTVPHRGERGELIERGVDYKCLIIYRASRKKEKKEKKDLIYFPFLSVHE